MFYLAAYAFMNIGAFAVVSHISGKGERIRTSTISPGWRKKQPSPPRC
jgi:NADH:ubiquinone oxidoreductase subunit 2 (subunit N)